MIEKNWEYKITGWIWYHPEMSEFIIDCHVKWNDEIYECRREETSIKPFI